MNCTKLSLVCSAIVTALAAPSVVAQEAESKHRKDVEVMVVSGSRLEQSLDSVAGSVVVIDEEAIARSMSTDFSSLFQNEAAVDVKGGAGKPSAVTIRGIGGNRVMMVKDGVRVNSQYASPLGPGAEGTGRGLTEVETLKQVEVVKAAASTMYGSDALGGVVVMNTKDASDYLLGDTGYFSANVGYTGMNNEYSAGFTFAHAFGDFENLVSYQRRYGEEQQNYDETLPVSDLVTDSLLVKSKYVLNEFTNIQLTLDFLNQQLDRWEDHASRPESIDYDRTTHAFNSSLRLRSEKPTFAHDNMDVVLYYGFTDQNEHRNYFDGNQGYVRSFTGERDYDFEEDRFGLASTFSKYIGGENYGHHLTYGVDVERSHMSRHRQYNHLENGDWTTTNPFAFADTESWRVGAFVQDDITLGQNLNIVAGLRYDYFRNSPDQQMAEDADRDPANFESMSGSFWSPKLGLIYKLTDTVSVYGQYAYGYKMPTPDQKWGELVVSEGNMPMDVYIHANYELESEESHTMEIGVRGNHSNTNYELTAFYILANDFIDWEYCQGMMPIGNTCNSGISTGSPLNYQYFNRDEVTLYGAEVSANHWLTNDVQLWGNIAYTRGEDQNGDYLNSVSPLKGTVGANFFTRLMGQEVDLGAVVRFSDKMTRTTDIDIFPGMDEFNEVYNTSGYAVVDLTAGMTLTQQLQLRAGVYNLMDKEYIDYADVAGQSKFLLTALGTPESNFTQPGRYFGISAKYTF
ncbi:TonB-dependent hemoglobin/transferrin/lactoferrin family receptor [Ferrimonas pelagia]|uniref:TonB-dependent hemoglobin/transferrin/lactoferrin family receptor n=1 Tax=Ferrimonas pelagia TaxID=1177826 RepID=A0ABP9F3P8_9GAMM